MKPINAVKDDRFFKKMKSTNFLQQNTEGRPMSQNGPRISTNKYFHRKTFSVLEAYTNPHRS